MADNKEKKLGRLSTDPMTGKTVFVKPGEQTPVEKCEQRRQAAITRLRQYVSEHGSGPHDAETDPMVTACQDAADLLGLLQIDGRELVRNMKLEPIWCVRRYPQVIVDKAQLLNSTDNLERQTAECMLEEVLYSGLVTTKTLHDTEAGELVVTAGMTVGVPVGEDVNELLREGKNFEKFTIPRNLRQRIVKEKED